MVVAAVVGLLIVGGFVEPRPPRVTAIAFSRDDQFELNMEQRKEMDRRVDALVERARWSKLKNFIAQHHGQKSGTLLEDEVGELWGLYSDRLEGWRGADEELVDLKDYIESVCGKRPL